MTIPTRPTVLFVRGSSLGFIDRDAEDNARRRTGVHLSCYSGALSVVLIELAEECTASTMSTGTAECSSR